MNVAWHGSLHPYWTRQRAGGDIRLSAQDRAGRRRRQRLVHRRPWIRWRLVGSPWITRALVSCSLTLLGLAAAAAAQSIAVDRQRGLQDGAIVANADILTLPTPDDLEKGPRSRAGQGGGVVRRDNRFAACGPPVPTVDPPCAHPFPVRSSSRSPSPRPSARPAARSRSSGGQARREERRGEAQGAEVGRHRRVRPDVQGRLRHQRRHLDERRRQPGRRARSSSTCSATST